jgi:uncharacterized cofD-like protein
LNSERSSLKALRVVAIGGGTGLPAVLRGLKRTLFAAEVWRGAGDRDRLTAIVTPTDDGGSSGRLRRAYGVLPPGDIRNCLLALADDDGPMRALFGFRFGGRDGVAGHSLGNLMLTALSLASGGVLRALEHAGQILSVRGRVLPATLADAVLTAELEDGSRARGETAIARAAAGVRRLALEPDDAPLPDAAREALMAANLVVIGPGSLYTSLLPPLLVRGVSQALACSRARVVLVMNVMTERGETDGLTASDHLRVLLQHVPELPIHDVLLNAVPIPDGVLARYAAAGAEPVACDSQAIEALGCRPVRRGLLADSPKVRHDSRALAAALVELVAAGRGARDGWRAAP